MKTYTNIKEVNKDIVNGVLRVEDDIHITFNECKIEADIVCRNLTAYDITAHNINANNINAIDINAIDLTARNIDYFAVCFAYENIICDSIEGGRENSKHFCLDGEITIREPKTIEVLGKTYNKKDVEERLRELQETANKQL